MPPQQNQNQPNFDFIMNPNQPSAKKSILPAGNSTGQRIAFVAIIGAVLVGLLLVIMLVLGSGGDNKQNYLKIAQEQTEIARVSALANGSTDQSLKNFAINTGATVMSDQKKLLATLGENGIAFDEKELILGQNAETDQTLATAKAAANFDAVLRSTLVAQLTDYQATTKTAFEKSGNADVKNQLTQIYTNTKLLLQQGQPEAPTSP